MIVVGGGHNGLVAANYLGRAGARVLVLERRRVVGGAAITEETWPGFKINTFAYVAGLLRQEIVDDLQLPLYGYRTILYDPQYWMPFPNGRALKLWVDTDRAAAEVAKFSVKDARAYPKYVEYWDHVLELLEPLMLAPPAPLAEMFQLFSTPETETLVRDLFLRSAKDLLDEWFESDEVKAVLVPNAVIGTMCGPSTPGTAYVLAHHNVGNLDGHKQVWGFSVGGMGGITQALARAAVANGVQIRTGVAVKNFLVQRGRVTGVETSTGETISAKIVASNADARTTFLKLTPPGSLPAEFEKGVRQIRSRGAALKFNAALSALPEFTAEPGAPSDAHRSTVDIAPSLEYLEEGYQDAVEGRFSSKPFIEMLFQSALDPSVAPPGKHTLTCFVQYAPTELRGTDWDAFKATAAERVLDTIAEYAPNIRRVVEHWQVVTPKDIEAILGMTGGNIFQGDITPDQILSFRPVPGWAQYRTPLGGLYLCGSAAHPGGGVTGAAGHNAAQIMLEDWHGVSGPRTPTSS
ncbi:MAG: NAD(P)/FAD-dependent oxidoreductase [Thermoplasmata archaeon]|nr:NAD(P)/FAD-dependent oxidoreductase [Thermoplasmata archaeon]